MNYAGPISLPPVGTREFSVLHEALAQYIENTEEVIEQQQEEGEIDCDLALQFETALDIEAELDAARAAQAEEED
jgi:frataxin-like iron-binding protein CyaY